jgi:hypothetical protein
VARGSGQLGFFAARRGARDRRAHRDQLESSMRSIWRSWAVARKLVEPPIAIHPKPV